MASHTSVQGRISLATAREHGLPDRTINHGRACQQHNTLSRRQVIILPRLRAHTALCSLKLAAHYPPSSRCVSCLIAPNCPLICDPGAHNQPPMGPNGTSGRLLWTHFLMLFVHSAANPLCSRFRQI